MSNRLIQLIRERRLHQANEEFADVIQRKTAVRLAQERRLVAEDVLDYDEPSGLSGDADVDDTKYPEKNTQPKKKLSEASQATVESQFTRVAAKYGFTVKDIRRNVPNRFQPSAVSDEILYERIAPRRSTILVSLYPDGRKHWLFKYTQTNGIYAPYGTGDTVGQLDRTLAGMGTRLNEGIADPMPVNWANGFQYPWRIGAGGTERPFLQNGAWKLRVWNAEDGKHYLYDYGTDMFEDETMGMQESFMGITLEPLTMADVQRVYNQVKNVVETELLCGLTRLQVDTDRVMDFLERHV